MTAVKKIKKIVLLQPSSSLVPFFFARRPPFGNPEKELREIVCRLGARSRLKGKKLTFFIQSRRLKQNCTFDFSFFFRNVFLSLLFNSRVFLLPPPLFFFFFVYRFPLIAKKAGKRTKQNKKTQSPFFWALHSTSVEK